MYQFLQNWRFVAVFLLAFSVIVSAERKGDPYSVGTGIADITGPANSEGMMGYAELSQRTNGIHMRLFARAFIIADPTSGDRIVFVNCELAFIPRAITQNVALELKEMYGDIYSEKNVILHGIHTHSGPGGYSYDVVFDVTTLGFNKKYTKNIVHGIVTSIQIAHENMEDNCYIFMNKGELTTVSVNRSPTSYTANPNEEKKEYQYDTDKEVLNLRIVRGDGSPKALMNWFAVHGVSMPNTNKLISSDNKGVAMNLVESYFNNQTNKPDKGPFLAAFSNANEGDSTPNIEGAFCPNGDHCDLWTSTCDGNSDVCRGRGPYGEDWFKNTWTIGSAQADKALEMWNDEDNAIPVTGPIKYKHSFFDFTDMEIHGNFTINGETAHTCKPAFGYSMAAGTTDGPGSFRFIQGDNSTTNVFWKFIEDHFLKKPSKEQIKCQWPKQVLIDMGEMETPWSPTILPIQVFSIGPAIFAAVPTEMTTMSGRRVKKTLKKALEDSGQLIENAYFQVAGLCNEYADYCATYEEFQYQRYEGGSTAYGPHTLEAYQQSIYEVATALFQDKELPDGPTPPDLSDHVFNFNPPDIADEVPPGKSFGDVTKQPESSYSISSNPTITVVFWGAQLRNEYMTNSTYLNIEKYDEATGNWTVYLTDSHWSTRIERKTLLVLISEITVTWIPIAPSPGRYRVRHMGHHVRIIGTDPIYYEGVSKEFELTL